MAIHTHSFKALIARVGITCHLLAILATLLFNETFLNNFDPFNKRLAHLLLHLIEPSNGGSHNFQFFQYEQKSLPGVKQRGHVVIDLEHGMRGYTVLVGGTHKL